MPTARIRTGNDLFDDSNEVKPKSAKFDKVGDLVKGVLVERRIIEDRNAKVPGGKVAIYMLLQDDGEVITVWGKHGNPRVLNGLEMRKLGDYVGVKFVKEVESRYGKAHPAKSLKVYFQSEQRLEVLEAYRAGKLGMDDAAEPVEHNPDM